MKRDRERMQIISYWIITKRQRTTLEPHHLFHIMARYSLRLRQNDNIINIIKPFARTLVAGFSARNLLINANCFNIVVHLTALRKRPDAPPHNDTRHRIGDSLVYCLRNILLINQIYIVWVTTAAAHSHGAKRINFNQLIKHFPALFPVCLLMAQFRYGDGFFYFRGHKRRRGDYFKGIPARRCWQGGLDVLSACKWTHLL